MVAVALFSCNGFVGNLIDSPFLRFIVVNLTCIINKSIVMAQRKLLFVCSLDIDFVSYVLSQLRNLIS